MIKLLSTAASTTMSAVVNLLHPEEAERQAKERLFSEEERVFIENINEDAVKADQLFFHVAEARKSDEIRARLMRILKGSKECPSYQRAASNAFTILVQAGVSFSFEDLEGINAPYADLSNGMFEGTILRNANLKYVNVTNCDLNDAILSWAQMKEANFSRLPILGHKGLDPLRHLHLTPDNRYLISQGDENLYCWDMNNGQCVSRDQITYYSDHVENGWGKILSKKTPRSKLPNKERQFAISVDGKFLFSISENGYLCVRRLPHLEKIKAFAKPISPQDSNITDTTEEIPSSSLAVSSDGLYLLQLYKLTKSEIKLWEVNPLLNQADLSGFKAICARQFPYEITQMKSSPCTSMIALATQRGEKSHTVELWSIPNWDNIGNFPLQARIQALEFSPDGQYLLFADQHRIVSWDWKKSKHPQSPLIVEDQFSIGSVRFVGNTGLIAYSVLEGTRRQQRKKIHFFNLLEKRASGMHFTDDELRNPLFEHLYNFEFIPTSDARYMVIGQVFRIVIWNMSNLSTQNLSFCGSLCIGEFSLDGSTFSIEDAKNIYQFDSKTGFAKYIEKKDEGVAVATNRLPSLAIEDSSKPYEEHIKNGEYAATCKSQDFFGTISYEGNIDIFSAQTGKKLSSMTIDVKLPKEIPKEAYHLICSSTLYPKGYIVFFDPINYYIWKIEENAQQLEVSYLRKGSHNYYFGGMFPKKIILKDKEFIFVIVRNGIFMIDFSNPFIIQKLEWGNKITRADDWYECLQDIDLTIHGNYCIGSFISVRVVSNESTLIFWEVERTDRLLSQRIMALAFFPDRAVEQELQRCKVLRESKVPFQIKNIQFSAAGSYVAVQGKQDLRLFEIQNQILKPLWTRPNRLEAQRTSHYWTKISRNNLEFFEEKS